jgi:hypothetical protein
MRNGRKHPQSRQPSLLLAGNDPWRETDRPHAFEKGLAVRGFAHRRRRHHARPHRAHLTRQQAEPLERPQCPGLRLLTEQARFADRAAEPGHHLFVEDHRRNPLRPRIDDEADGVGSDIDDRDRRLGEHRAQCGPRGSDSFLGTAPLDRNAAPRPDSDGLVMK